MDCGLQSAGNGNAAAYWHCVGDCGSDNSPKAGRPLPARGSRAGRSRRRPRIPWTSPGSGAGGAGGALAPLFTTAVAAFRVPESPASCAWFCSSWDPRLRQPDRRPDAGGPLLGAGRRRHGAPLSRRDEVRARREPQTRARRAAGHPVQPPRHRRRDQVRAAGRGRLRSKRGRSKTFQPFVRTDRGACWPGGRLPQTSRTKPVGPAI